MQLIEWCLSKGRLLTLLTMLTLAACTEKELPETIAVAASSSLHSLNSDNRPNILLIVADDLGYTDLGSFGGEINTPTLDDLAESGLRLSNFHTAPTCSPTRAMLLSGTDNHIAGLGAMAEAMPPNLRGRPGYEGYLNERVASLPSLLQDAGYRTYMAGKWHLGQEEHNSPMARGFDLSYALLDGGAGHFDMLAAVGPGQARYREDGNLVEVPEDFYSTRFYVDKLIDYTEANKNENRPFFAYLAFTAPHWPLQAPEDSIAKYKSVYDAGYDVLYKKRMEGLESKGLMPEGAKEWHRLPGEKAWNVLSDQEKRYEARRMEIYAAMVDDMDIHTGRLLKHLERIGERDNTLIIFMSDNGADPGSMSDLPMFVNWLSDCCDNSFQNMGKANSLVWYGPNWARAGSAPYKGFKGLTSGGGIRVPAFIHFAGIKRQGEVSDTFISVKDVMPTLLDFAGTAHPGERYKGRDVAPIQGKSMYSFLSGETDQVHDGDYVMGWEIFSNLAIQQGDWKITQRPVNPMAQSDSKVEWELYNIKNDPSEQTDLAVAEPGKLKELILHWEQYAKDNRIILPEWKISE